MTTMKAGELKPLDLGKLRWFAGRCALRCAPWGARDDRALHAQAMRAILAPSPLAEPDAAALIRALSDSGARAYNALATIDEPRARCANYASLVLAEAVRASASSARPEAVKAALLAAKYTASIPLLLAHAAQSQGAADRAAIDETAAVVWASIRQDVARIAAHAAHIESIEALAALGPLELDAFAPPAAAR